MSNYGILLLSKVIDTNDPSALARLNIAEAHFNTEAERKAYRFIKEYAEQNRGQAPSYATVTEECPGFFYTPEVGDSYEYLTRKLLNESADAEFTRFINDGRLAQMFEGKRDDMQAFISDLQAELETIRIRTDVRNKVGTNIKTDNEEFLAEYERRKKGESFRMWKSRFQSMPDYISGNMYTVYGKSGRGKSVVTLEEAIEAAMQGANVLIWAMEMGWFEVLVRIYVSISGRKGLTTMEHGGLNLTGGFDSSEVRNGKLSDEFEVAFRFFLDTMNDEIPGNITVRAVDHADFQVRTIRQLESDILQTKADVVVVDPFYYMHYEKNSEKTTGGGASTTSMALRHLAGRTQTVIFAITQADETKQHVDDDGNRELEIPNREDVKKTTQLLEDAYLLIGVDTDYKQGRGLIGLNKGRDGGEGNTTEILYIPQNGIVREFEVGESAVSDFDF